MLSVIPRFLFYAVFVTISSMLYALCFPRVDLDNYASMLYAFP